MRNPDRETIFRFKQFAVVNRLSAMKVGTDGVLLGAWCWPEDTDGNLCLEPIAGERTEKDKRRRRILDVGCGTGLITLMLAQRFPDAHIVGVEIDEESADEALQNVKNSKWCDKIIIHHADFNTCNELEDDAYDLIVSNPPFFTNGLDAPNESRNQARHETTLTLHALLVRGAQLLTKKGKIALVLPAERLGELQKVGVKNGLMLSRVCLVSTVPHKPPRRLLAELTNYNVDPTCEEQLSIHDSNGNFTKEYIELTKDFYLKF